MYNQMKNYFFLLLFCAFSFSAKAQEIASCCTSEEARCIGSSNCRACTNCSRCAHCNSGGSCGVCSGYRTTKSSNSSNKTYNSTRQSDNSYSNSNNLYKLTRTYYINEVLLVKNETLNLREGAGTHYQIIEKLKQNDVLFFLEKQGEWIKVKVKKSENIGWVYVQYVE